MQNKEQIEEQQMEQIAKHAKAEGLPLLIGRPKQVAWAETIRHRMFAEVKEFLAADVIADRIIVGITHTFWLEDEVIDSDIKQGIRAICAQTSAEWWIEHRHLTDDALIALMVDTINSVALIRRSNAKISAN